MQGRSTALYPRYFARPPSPLIELDIQSLVERLLRRAQKGGTGRSSTLRRRGLGARIRRRGEGPATCLRPGPRVYVSFSDLSNLILSARVSRAVQVRVLYVARLHNGTVQSLTHEACAARSELGRLRTLE